MTGEKREEGVKPCVLSEGVMCASGCIANLVITDLTWRIKTQRSAEKETNLCECVLHCKLINFTVLYTLLQKFRVISKFLYFP